MKLRKFTVSIGALVLILAGLATVSAASSPPPPSFDSCQPIKPGIGPLPPGIADAQKATVVYLGEAPYGEAEASQCRFVELPAEPAANLENLPQPMGCPITRQWVVIYPCGSCGFLQRWVGSCWQVVDPCGGYEGPVRCDWACLRCG